MLDCIITIKSHPIRLETGHKNITKQTPHSIFTTARQPQNKLENKKINHINKDRQTESTDVETHANQLVENGYIGKAQERVDQHNQKYSLGQFPQNSGKPLTEHQQKSEQILRKIYPQYNKDLDPKAQNQQQQPSPPEYPFPMRNNPFGQMINGSPSGIR